MKKAIIAIAAVMFLIACGGSTEQTNTDSTATLGTDSSVVTDSIKIDTTAVCPDGGRVTLKPVK